MTNVQILKPMKPINNTAIDIVLIIISVLMSFLALVGIVASGFWVYTKIVPTIGPETHATTYTNTLIDEDGEERYFMEVEYWENKLGNGKECFEFSFNAYTGLDALASRQVIKKGAQWINTGEDINKPGVNKSSGISGLLAQMFKQYKNWSGVGKLPVLQDWAENCYDKVATTAWTAVEAVKVNEPLYITMQNGDVEELYSATMNGKWTEYVEQFNFFKSVGNAFKGLAGKANYSDPNTWYDYLPIEHSYTMLDFYNTIMRSVTNTSNGYGTSICSMVDLAKFFEIKKFNVETQQWNAVTAGHDVTKDYFAIKVTKHADGIRRATDSTYHMVDNRADWTLVPTDGYYEDYTDVYIEKALTEKDFNYYFNPGHNGYVAELKPEIKATLSSAAPYAVTINVNDPLFSSHRNIVGLFIDADIKFASITITLNVPDNEGNTFFILKPKTCQLPSKENMRIINTNGTKPINFTYMEAV